VGDKWKIRLLFIWKPVIDVYLASEWTDIKKGVTLCINCWQKQFYFPHSLKTALSMRGLKHDFTSCLQQY
jgi:hypothetical protein